ncbi:MULTISPECIES: pyrroline-5-carboxylate reductase [Clostridium]|uniref:Pyrroline-5-carboxylate reductase n=1 Tax=Clostridium cadaveris TaxID=1529 RepID=A0A1I2L6Z3_9CLOT|nr:pyrroline-5-carboxylate reductase [Clostridium cadaveris]MDU4951712.1 pyrroline-5-carboxylate reductase [Clostridium sp.]MDM8311329.1 pyrroline-5-carboxylate reductase [Clostridium cadaveris]NWK09657.1 pyrroline-5-carboxylate reductase [Clostridium cadaveris]PWL52410.1 MAG: pyrroline-5-carboxylate reductase [Clostridium cadaveris]SFF75094.1 pyrroline-5-carboxylate reductase [Clostridium cadaveris]
MNKTIGFIGCGNMAGAIIGGLVSSGKVKGENVIASDGFSKGLENCKKKYGIRTSLNDNLTVAREADILFLAVKPNVYFNVIDEIKNDIKENVVIVTIAAAISMDSVKAGFGKEIKIVRTMPNTAAMIGESMTVACKNSLVTEEEMNEVMELLKSFGKAEFLEEKLMEAVIAVNGSSPAYIYMFLEAMGDGGVLAGIPRDKAYKMAAQAMIGSAKMLLETGKHPGELKDMVCSPAGTTIEAVYSLEKNNFRGTIIEAMEKCTEKSNQMAGKK